MKLDEREEYRNISIEFSVGIAETFEGKQTARRLLAEAIKSKKTYVSGADTDTENKENEEN